MQKKIETERKRNVICLRLDDQEMRMVAAAAHDKWSSCSGFVRELVMAALSSGAGNVIETTETQQK